MEDGVRTASTTAGIWEDIDLLASIKEGVDVELVATRGRGEAGTRSIIESPPKTLNDSVLPAVIRTSSGDKNPLRAGSGDSGAASIGRVKDVLVISVKPFDLNTDSASMPKNLADGLRGLGLVLEKNKSTPGRVVVNGTEAPLETPTHGRSAVGPQVEGHDLTGRASDGYVAVRTLPVSFTANAIGASVRGNIEELGPCGRYVGAYSMEAT